MSASIQYDLIQGVVARVFAHELAPPGRTVACYSYITDGLAAFGQRELVFTLVREPAAAVQQAPHEPLHLLQTIAGLAQQGRVVEAGGLTELGPTGVFGRPALRGFAYQTAWPMEGVNVPAGALAMVALVGDEVDTAKRFGTQRVLARLGRIASFWPTAPWCELDRQASAPTSQTILDGVASAHVPGVSVVLDQAAQRVVVRLARRAHAQLSQAGLPPPETAVALLTVLDPDADACLAWFPGQTSPEAISAPNSRGTRISGCFIAFVPQQQSDGANIFEDGFAAMLTDASWARVRHGLLSCANVEIPGGNALAIEWYDEAAPRTETRAVSEMQMNIREPQMDVDARVGMQALVDYAGAIEKLVQQHYAGQRGHGQTLTFDVLLMAGRAPTFYGTLEPALYEQLAALTAPPLRDGEIAFRGTFALFGGPS